MLSPRFLFGARCSSNNTITSYLAKSNVLECLNEDDPRAFRNFCLYENTVIRRLLAEYSDKHLFFKCIADTPAAPARLRAFPDASAIYSIRRPVPYLASFSNASGTRPATLWPNLFVEAAAGELSGLASIACRDPLIEGNIVEAARASSALLDQYGVTPANVAAACYLYQHSFGIELGMTDQVKVVDYDWLTRDPIAAMRAICDHFHISYCDAMGESWNAGRGEAQCDQRCHAELLRRCEELYNRIVPAELRRETGHSEAPIGFGHAADAAAQATGSADASISVEPTKPMRSEQFRQREHNRYWWYRLKDTDYVPLVLRGLSDAEWRVLDAWFTETGAKYENPGEISIPGISMLAGIISGNGIGAVVQCGHYVGFSTLLIGFLLRSMGKKNALFSIDIDAAVTGYTQSWVDRAALNEYVALRVGTSSAPSLRETVRAYFSRDPQLVFIDSSHQYTHTLDELDLWYDALVPGGLLVLHDVSVLAQAFDRTNGGGVLTAAREWLGRRQNVTFDPSQLVR